MVQKSVWFRITMMLDLIVTSYSEVILVEFSKNFSLVELTLSTLSVAGLWLSSDHIYRRAQVICVQ